MCSTAPVSDVNRASDEASSVRRCTHCVWILPTLTLLRRCVQIFGLSADVEDNVCYLDEQHIVYPAGGYSPPPIIVLIPNEPPRTTFAGVFGRPCCDNGLRIGLCSLCPNPHSPYVLLVLAGFRVSSLRRTVVFPMIPPSLVRRLNASDLQCGDTRTTVYLGVRGEQGVLVDGGVAQSTVHCCLREARRRSRRAHL
jgi:hypothetical protein